MLLADAKQSNCEPAAETNRMTEKAHDYIMDIFKIKPLKVRLQKLQSSVLKNKIPCVQS